MKKHPSIRQMKYAYGLMNEQKSRYQIAIDAGFSPSTARVPQVIENAQGFSLAVAKIAGEAENVTMKLLFELNARDLSKESFPNLLSSLDILSKTTVLFASKIKPDRWDRP